MKPTASREKKHLTQTLRFYLQTWRSGRAWRSRRALSTEDSTLQQGANKDADASQHATNERIEDEGEQMNGEKAHRSAPHVATVSILRQCARKP